MIPQPERNKEDEGHFGGLLLYPSVSYGDFSADEVNDFILKITIVFSRKILPGNHGFYMFLLLRTWGVPVKNFHWNNPMIHHEIHEIPIFWWWNHVKSLFLDNLDSPKICTLVARWHNKDPLIWEKKTLLFQAGWSSLNHGNNSPFLLAKTMNRTIMINNFWLIVVNSG